MPQPSAVYWDRPLTEAIMSLGLILLIVLIVLLLGAVPSWPYSRSWGPHPSGGLGLILLIVLILWLLHVV